MLPQEVLVLFAALDHVIDVSDELDDDETAWTPYERSRIQKAIDDVFQAYGSIRDAGLGT